MNNEVLEYLKELIKRRYGSLDDERGAYLNGRWLSVKSIVELIDQADASYDREYEVTKEGIEEADCDEEDSDEENNCEAGLYDCSTCPINGDCLRQDESDEDE